MAKDEQMALLIVIIYFLVEISKKSASQWSFQVCPEIWKIIIKKSVSIPTKKNLYEWNWGKKNWFGFVS